MLWEQDFSAGRFEIALGIGRAFNPMGYSIPDNKGLAPSSRTRP